ncbi:L6 family member 1 Membrane component chromosome 3 surface marker 1 Tumor-associated antigen [Triplophysa tibetana]|uniref:L6 family member 1 Membrane component chromosome 3 surface marker 1 Tumor-associated antigen n=1 Tax=Triplophysa tibetana TaxID=1572043 RepID=A0A5A9NVZ4_9TELE|nr:L6 family member 1 Membrane component chromosome 3 surface marker 1 Tumor-associated antigen [Triplophysa tibetana]
MCSLGFARSLGFALLPLATCCIVANVLLFFPDAQVTYVKENNVTTYVWYFMGIGGGGLAILIAAFVFLGMGKCADGCGTESCAMCGSVLAALVGMAGSGYCFLISAFALLKGPYCLTKQGWMSPFENDGAKYLLDCEEWSECIQPKHIVEWNVTLLAILLGLSTFEFIICVLQLISGLVNAVFRPCCYKQEYNLNV